MKLITLIAMSLFTTASFANVTTQIEFTGTTINCLVYNNTNTDIEITDVTYEANTSTVGYTSQVRPCYNNCRVPSFLVARFRGPNNNSAIINASCEAGFRRL